MADIYDHFYGKFLSTDTLSGIRRQSVRLRYLVITFVCAGAFVGWKCGLSRNYLQDVDPTFILRNSTLRSTEPVQGNLQSWPKKILIVAYYRSGSSLTGSVFSDNNNTFYDFEPLFALHRVAIPNNGVLQYLNGKTRITSNDTTEMTSAAANILSTIFSCQYDQLDYLTLTRKLCAIKNPSASIYCQCKRLKPVEEIFKDCIPDYTKLCLNAQYRVVKTIRSGMDIVRSVLEKHPDLKVIHLLRDVRGIICSPLSTKICEVPEQKVIEICSQMQQHIDERLRLENIYPESLKEVIYEDLVADPVRVAESMYEFVGSYLPIQIGNILRHKTQEGAEYDGPHGTSRKNGSQTAYRWQRRITWKTVEQVNRHCASVLEHGKFPYFRSPDELTNFRIPDRRF